MKHLSTRIIAIVLTLVMTLSLMPVQAFASLVDNDPEYNREMLNTIRDIVGSEDEAELYYAMMEHYGLLDEDGNLMGNWSIRMDGSEISLSELREILSGDFDPNKMITVDGTPVSLADVKTMIEIEDYVSYIRDTYYSDGEWTQEQKDAYASLVDQVSTEGIKLRSGNTAQIGGSLLASDDCDLAARVSITQEHNGQFRADLTGAAPGQEVRFTWRIRPINCKLYDGATAMGLKTKDVVFNAGQDGCASVTFGPDDGFTVVPYTAPGTENCLLLLDVRIVNALLADEDGSAKDVMSRVFRWSDFTGQGTPAGLRDSISIPAAEGTTVNDGTYLGWTLPVYDDEESLPENTLDLIEALELSRQGYYTDAQISYIAEVGPIDNDQGFDILEGNKYLYPHNGSVDLGFYRHFTALQNGSRVDLRAKNDNLDSSLIPTGKSNAYDLLDYNHVTGGIVFRKTFSMDYLPSSLFTAYLNNDGPVTGYDEPSIQNSAIYIESAGGATSVSQMYSPYENYRWRLAGASLVFDSNTAPKLISDQFYAIENGTYCPGMCIPLLALFTEPVKASRTTIRVNGQTLRAVRDAGDSRLQVFLYPVSEAAPQSLRVTEYNTEDVFGNQGSSFTDQSFSTISVSVSVESVTKPHTFTGVSAKLGWEPQTSEYVLSVSADISDDPERTAWLLSALELDAQERTAKFNGLYYSVYIPGAEAPYNGHLLFSIRDIKGGTEGAVTGGKLVDRLYIPVTAIPAADEPLECTVLLHYGDPDENGDYQGSNPAFDLYDTFVIRPKKLIAKENLSIRVVVEYEDPDLEDIDRIMTRDYSAQEAEVIPVDLSASPTIRVIPVLDNDDYSFGDTSYCTTVGDDQDPYADFVWGLMQAGTAEVTSSCDCADIDKDGYITPKYEYAVFPILFARNGNIASVNNGAFFVLQFQSNHNPYLAIPNSSREIKIPSETSFPLYWNSNLWVKAGGSGAYHVALYLRGSTELKKWEGDTEGEGVIIPGEYLTYWYDSTTGRNWNEYTAVVSYTLDGKEYSASVDIEITAAPAQVSFGTLDSYYLRDTAGSVEIPWTISNFDKFTDGMFEMQVMRGNEEVVTITAPGTHDGWGGYTGRYTLSLSDVVSASSDPTSFRQVYTVTVKAKNGTDSTWSYDSFLLYVYDEEALRILVDGKNADSLTMSNIPQISQMSSAEILALGRDISLHNVISANYGEFAWAELADRLAWASSNNSVATINYLQGDVYEDIRSYSYSHYRPATDFLLSGLGNGTTRITATHSLTGMTDTLDVAVETLKDKLYLFQANPKVKTELSYENGDGNTVTVYTDDNGALALYEESGIASTLYCKATSEGTVYLGTFKADSLLSGEQDHSKLELYPCNYLTLRQAAYAYVYLKNPDGTPYTGDITFRGGVYFNNSYQPQAAFGLNTGANPSVPGNVDQTVTLGTDGKLEITMDQTQWTAGDSLNASSSIRYAFCISCANNDDYYPLLINMDASINVRYYISSGNAIVNFRSNPSGQKHPFLIGQHVVTNGTQTDILCSTDRIGPSDTSPTAMLTSIAMWWGEDRLADAPNRLQLFTADGQKIADNASYSSNVSCSDAYPFIDQEMTTYTVELSADSLDGTVSSGTLTGTYLEYYRDGTFLTRKEDLGIRICNMTGVGSVDKSDQLNQELASYGTAMNTSGSNKMDLGDMFVNSILRLVAREEFTDGDEHLFEVKIAPTSDPTKFIGFMQANYGDRIEDAADTGFTFLEQDDLEYGEELALLDRIEMARQSPDEWGADQKKEIKDAMNNRGGGMDWNVSVGGYMEVLIYYDFINSKWTMQPVSGGFHVGGGLEYSQSWNYMVGPVPFTTELTAGGNVEVSLDAVSASYLKTADSQNIDVATEFLTQLRIYMYLRLFAGVGFDYSVVAFKLGIFGLISLDMQFAWLNRPYLEKNPGALLLATGVDDTGNPNPPAANTESANLSGQHVRLNGQIGVELIIKFLFFEMDWVLLSYSFDLFNESFNNYDSIQDHWENNQKNLQRTIKTLVSNGDASLMSVGGRTLAAVSLAPMLQSRDYLDNGDREWGYTPRRGPANSINNLESNTYPYANPELTRDGQIMVYLTDQQSEDITETRAAYATSGWPTYEQGGLIDDGGFGDSDLTVDGTDRFAVAAWSRQMVDLKKEAGYVLNDDEKMLMMSGTDIFASVYTDGAWQTTRLTENIGPDLAPTAAVSGDRAIVAWRSVLSGDTEKYTEFDQQDMILYRIYEGGSWSDTMTLYNGTSGAVKGITSAMMSDGTAAVAYTIDTEGDNNTFTDREIVYGVIGRTGSVVRNIRATNNNKVDENPQLAAVTLPQDGREHFLLGWYTQNLNGTGNNDMTSDSDIGLLDFDANGLATNLIPESMSKVAAAPGVSVSSNFRFTKNADSITDLSLVWVERDSGTDMSGSGTGSVDKDVLKSVKFFLYGRNDNIGYTGALRVAEMSDATLIDHFDVYTTDGTTLKAVVLGTTYGANGVVEKTGQTASGETVVYTVPSATYSMFTATDTYATTFDVPALAVDYDAVRLGADTLVGLSVKNEGIEPITDITVNIGDYTTTFTDLEILPGYTADLWADYTVPAGGVENPAYSVSAAADSDGDGSGDIMLPEVSGGIMMDLPDLEITDAKILEEVNGLRTIQIKLNNLKDSVLEGSGRRVKLSFWNDATYQTPIESMADVIISSNADLKMIDEGGYSTQVTFDVATYLKAGGDEVVEITDGGVPVYIKAEVLQDVNGKAVAVPEPAQSNNYATVTCENIRLRTGQDVMISSDVATENGSTSVTVHLQNTRLTATQTGNLIVYLLDDSGKIIAQQQSYDETKPNNGLITLGGEEKKDVSFSFDKVGASVRFAYTDLLMGDDTSDLGALEIEGISEVSATMFMNGTAEVTVDDMSGTVSYSAAAGSPLATVSVSLISGETATALPDSDKDSYRAIGTLSLTPGTDTVIRIHVENATAEGETEKDYTLTIHNNGEPVIGATFDLHSGTSVTLLASAQPMPASPGYPVAYHWYACDAEGGNRTEISGCADSTAAQADVTGSFGSTPVYYICEITRTKLDGSTATYLSNVVTVSADRIITIKPLDVSKTYGDEDPAMQCISEDPTDAEVYAMGFTSHDEMRSVWANFLTYNLTYTREAGEDVGEYTIRPRLDTRTYGEYYFAIETGTMTINPASATVTADLKTKFTGDPDPELTATVTGLKNGDTADVLSYSLSREAGETRGTYVITPSGNAVQGNYIVTFVPSTLLISAAHRHDGISFLPWNDPDALPTEPGSYYLACDVTLTSEWETGYNAAYDETGDYAVYNLCLNGHTVRGEYCYLSVSHGTQLNLYDDTESGCITGLGGSAFGAVNVEGEFNLYSGRISGNRSGNCGGGVSVGQDAVFQMYGGEISGNEAGDKGGGVYLESGQFNMCGGEISGNYAQYGGGIAIDDFGWQQVSCHISGGTLSYNGAQTGHGEEIYYNASFETLDQADSLTISGGRIEGAESMIAIDVHSGQNFILSGKVEVTGAILTATDKPLTITDDISGPYRIALVEPGEDSLTFTAGVFTSGLDGKGAAGSFISYVRDYIVTTAANGEAQLVDKDSVTVYTITFKNDDCSDLTELEVAAGEMPVYPWQTPEKDGYIFSGWTPVIVPASGNATYTAVYTESIEPKFKGHQIVLSGQIGMYYYLTIPEAYVSGSYMEFDIGGQKTTVETTAGLKQQDGRFRFLCGINAVQMADTITAAFHYTDGETAKTAEYVTTVEDYLNVLIANEDNIPAYAAAAESAKALNDYGYYSQLAVDTEAAHTRMKKAYKSVSELIPTLDGCGITATLGSGVTSASYSLSLTSETKINLFFATDGLELTNANTHVTVNDSTTFDWTVEKVGERYRVQITGINAVELGATFTVTIDGGTTVTASALSYVQQVLSSNSAVTDEVKHAAAALYSFFDEVCKYNN
ncbi:MAG: hypothetical protein K5855_10250 [Oscillospiraceae bacterium]|nr:hypothetical protein [Oscillospiraceae bacterium]